MSHLGVQVPPSAPGVIMFQAPKACPIQKVPVPQGPWLVAGRTKMMLGVRVNKTWNATTKQFEWMTRPGISFGTNGGKVFKYGPSKLI